MTLPSIYDRKLSCTTLRVVIPTTRSVAQLKTPRHIEVPSDRFYLLVKTKDLAKIEQLAFLSDKNR